MLCVSAKHFLFFNLRLRFYEVRVLNDPSLHLDRDPERIDPERNDAKQEPFDIRTEQLTARTVKLHLLTVDNRVLCNPSFLHANSPRNTDTKREDRHKRLQNADTDQTK